MSMLSAFAGLAEQAQTFGDTALRLSPRDPFSFRTYMAKALACILNQDFEGLLSNAEKGIALNPRTSVLFRYKAIALHELGRIDEAAVICAQTLEMSPGFSTRNFIHELFYSLGVNETFWSKYEALLLRAGFPE